jgi:putative adenylate-forming enzyme
VYSVAEVLSFDDKQKLEDYFKQPIHQIYQATEGFLGATCEHGNLHLNEEFVHFEFEWLDKQKTRAIPIITDFTRKTQPIIRYKMTDVLIMDKQPCPCGRHTHVVQAIEGRSDDIINAPSSYETSDTIPLFSDPLHRALLQCLPIATDYRLHYAWKSHTFTLYVNQHLSTLVQEHIISRMKQYLEAQGVILEKIQFNLCFQSFDFNPMVKVRRITMTP